MPRLAALVFLLLALPLHANLGDTVADCVKRYGKPDNFTEANATSLFGTLTFTAGPYQMTIFLHNNVEVGASVTKKDKTAFTPDEIKTILNADALMPWTPTTSNDPGSPRWTRTDDSTAEYDATKNILIFTTPAMVKVLHAPPPPPPPVEPAPAPPPSRPQGNFAPAAPTPWAPPTPPSTNVPATNAP